MSTPTPITIDITVDRPSTKEVLRALVHAILFHRLFGTVKPQVFEVGDVTLPGVSDTEMEQLVDEKVNTFWRGIDTAGSKRGQIFVTFSQRVPKKSWFSMGEEDVPWEQWIINAEVRQPSSERDRQQSKLALSTALSKALKLMLNYTSSDRGRDAVPLITNSTGISPFPVKIAVRVAGVEVG